MKHKTACEATRRDFVPFIVSTDGCVGEQAEAFLKRLGRRLAEKWQRSYSQVMGFIRSRMAVTILRASLVASVCVHAWPKNKDPGHRVHYGGWCCPGSSAVVAW